MKISVVKVLGQCQKIYAQPDRMIRFEHYQRLMRGTDEHEALPMGAFSPMGKEQARYIDELIAIDAESVAELKAQEAAASLSFIDVHFKLALVVVGESKRGWTERSLTDAEWRLESRYDQTRQRPTNADRWVSVQLWTDEHRDSEWVEKEVLHTIYRAAHVECFGRAKTLDDILQQEGRAAHFAQRGHEVHEATIKEIQETLAPFRQSTSFPIHFAALYGDDAAVKAGYKPLGLDPRAGFVLAHHEAIEAGSPIECLRKSARALGSS